MKKLVLIILIFSSQSYGQVINGYVYDSEGRVSNITISNISQDIKSETDEYGYFGISARVGDTILFNSIGYKEYKFPADKKHFEENIVINLKYNSLDVVQIRGFELKPVDIENLDDELSLRIAKDIIKFPEFYEPHKGNIRYLFQDIMRLFKKNKNTVNRKENNSEKSFKLGFEEWKLLFENDKILNEQFLLEELHLRQEYHTQFFEFLSAKNIPSKFLEEKLKLNLIQAVYKGGIEFSNLYKS